MMKKKMAFIVLALLMVFTFSSCDFWYGIFGDPFVGTWKITAETFNGTPMTIGPSGLDVTVTVKKDNTLDISAAQSGGAPVAMSGTWSRSGTTYTVLTPSQPSGGVTITFTGTLSSDNKTIDFTITPVPGVVPSGSATWTRQ
jgi:hypothetical protein